MAEMGKGKADHKHCWFQSVIYLILFPLDKANPHEALRHYGVSENSTSLFVVSIGSSKGSNMWSIMDWVVRGTLSPLTALQGVTDWGMIKKVNSSFTA